MKITDGGIQPDFRGEYPAAWVTKSADLTRIQDCVFDELLDYVGIGKVREWLRRRTTGQSVQA